MPRKRMIDPGLWVDEGFVELSMGARLLWIGLISMADDHGRGMAGPKSIKAQIFASDDTTLEEIDAWKTEVAARMQIHFYGVGNREYYSLDRWKTYQYVHSPKPSTHPDCSVTAAIPYQCRNDAVIVPFDERAFTRNGMEGKGKETITADPLPHPDGPPTTNPFALPETAEPPPSSLPHLAVRDSHISDDKTQEYSDGAPPDASPPPDDTTDNGEYSVEFETFWSACKRKVGKKAAYRQWRARVRQGVSKVELLRGAQGYYTKCLREGRDETHMMHPETLIGANDRWKDYLGGSQAQSASLTAVVHPRCPECGEILMTDADHTLTCVGCRKFFEQKDEEGLVEIQFQGSAAPDPPQEPGQEVIF